MKNNIPSIPLRISILSTLTMVIIIVLLIYALFFIEIEDVIYTGPIEGIKIEDIKDINDLNVNISGKDINFNNLADFETYRLKAPTKNSIQCTLSTDKLLIYYLIN